MENYKELFLSELDNYIGQVDARLIELERDPRKKTAIFEIFRIFHTVKGMAQTMGYEDLARVSHRIEDLLIPARDTGAVDLSVVEFLFNAVDYLRSTIPALRSNSDVPDSQAILEAIGQLEKGEKTDLLSAGPHTTRTSEIRIRMEKLDKLLNASNELLVARHRLARLSSEINDQRLIDFRDTVDKLIESVRDEVTRLRMLPLSNIFDFFPRWFRDEARKLAQAVELEISGGDIEADRSVIEALKEPLMHLVRNALDHGFSGDSADLGRRNTVKITAVRQKDWIQISVVDNGRGIDWRQIRDLAVERNLISAADARVLDKEGAYRILLRPDFSVRDIVSEISGRGIGLDIVGNAISRLGGRLHISSELGGGSQFSIEFPVSIAIIRAMVCRLDGQRFAIPVSYVQETFNLKEEAVRIVHHRELYRLRDEILPLIRLGDILKCQSNGKKKTVIVVQYLQKKRGFVIDEIIDETDIVTKKIDSLLAHDYYSGSAIYSDGLPMMIIDPRGFQ